MHAGVTLDQDAAPGHAGADTLDTRGVADNADLAVGHAFDVEEIADLRPLIAVLERGRGDLRRRQPLKPVRGDGVRFERYRRLGVKGEGEAHAVPSAPLSKAYSPILNCPRLPP